MVAGVFLNGQTSLWLCHLALIMLQAEQGYKYAKAAPFHCCIDTKQMDGWTKLFLREWLPLSIQTAPICLSSAPSLGKKKVNTKFKHYHIFLSRVIGLTDWCSISLSAMVHSESHWMMVPSGAQKDTLSPLASLPLLKKMGTANTCAQILPQATPAEECLGWGCTI